MSVLLKTWTPQDVQQAAEEKGGNPADVFCKYVQQAVGVPFPTGKDIVIVRRRAKEFFAAYPHTNWYTLCRVANWCKARKRRPTRPWMVIDHFRDAWSAGFIPELNDTTRVNESVEERIAKVLQVERRESWRRRFVMAQGEARERVLSEWESEQRSSSSSH